MAKTEKARPGSGAGLPTTGGDVQRQMATMRAHLIARYRLFAVPGRPEELEHANGRRVSLGYGSKTIRVRLQEGRDWKERHDFQIAEGWGAVLYAMCDPWFAIADTGTLADFNNPNPVRLRPETPWEKKERISPIGLPETVAEAVQLDPRPGMLPNVISWPVPNRPRPIRDNPQA